MLHFAWQFLSILRCVIQHWLTSINFYPPEVYRECKLQKFTVNLSSVFRLVSIANGIFNQCVAVTFFVCIVNIFLLLCFMFWAQNELTENLVTMVMIIFWLASCSCVFFLMLFLTASVNTSVSIPKYIIVAHYKWCNMTFWVIFESSTPNRQYSQITLIFLSWIMFFPSNWDLVDL